ncbi:MAG: Verru_Chthon cassette protein A [Verrucomicrobiaceae bacterium]|nr:Verru_Chthon cassette protein A [Verrucomicrobiaceae bacterium]
MKLSLLSRLKKDRRGLALIIVVTSIALISVLVVAIFSVTRTEFRATQSYVAAKSAKQLGDIAVSIVQAQIQNGQAISTQGTFHATQPGMVRVYNADGSFNSALKLYSSQQMKVTGQEIDLLAAANLAPSNWDTLPARFVDLNEPVVRPGTVTSAQQESAGYAIYFPIIDPRAAYNTGSGGQTANETGVPGTTQVEGFSYEKSSALLGQAGTSYASQVVTVAKAASDPKRLRLPMPVEWMYILEDGTVGSLNAANRFVSSSGGATPSATNPIVGRIAFWTDDESCKININTASEPTFMSTPFYYHQRDAKWAHFPATTGEYQRYPGHPATTALSAVLAPNYLLDTYMPGRDNGGLSRAQVVEVKEKIYGLIPKIGPGGSEAGTRPFVQDDFSAQNQEGAAANSINLTESFKERLFASVDEMLFLQTGYTTATGRAPARFAMPGAAGRFLFDHDTLERSRFFLTAHSRSPEFTLHGLPRVCMWPISDESLGNNRRTSFDNMIALCGTIKRKATDDVNSGSPDRTYYFRRAVSYTDPSDSRSGGQSGSTFDLTGNSTLSRNTKLLEYLSAQMSELEWPATGASGAGSAGGFDDKYGMNNVYQLAVQFFDYIRCTNLYDGILARDNDAGGKPGGYASRDNQRSDNFTFTPQRIVQSPNTVNNVTAELGASNIRARQSGVLPGHGQVSPAMWDKGNTFKGFGRMFTISEIGFQFICTADGLNDSRSLNSFPAPTPAGRGGGTALRYDPENDAVVQEVNIPNTRAYEGFAVDDLQYQDSGIKYAVWYSNFPPIVGSELAMMEFYGCKADQAGSPTHPARHPGFSPSNWNYSLAANTPLDVTEKRVQMTFLLETFCPSVGWTKFYPEFTITLSGDSAAQMKLNGKDLFNTTGDIPIKSNGNIYDDSTSRVSPMGGHAGPTMLLSGRRTRVISGGGGAGGPAAAYGSVGGTVLLPSDTGYEDGNTSGHQALNNYTFVSDYVTVDRNNRMEFTFPQEPLVIKIYDTHRWESAQPVQEIQIDFNQLNLPTELPVPHLVGSTNPIDGYPEGDARYFGGPRVNTQNGVMNGQYFTTIDGNGRNVHRRSLQGPHFWGYLWDGVLGRGQGQFNPAYSTTNGEAMWSVQPNLVPSGGDAVAQVKRGRLDTTSGIVDRTLPPGDYFAGVGIIPDATSDVIRTIVPAVGDYRILAARRFVPTEMWKPHPLWRQGFEQVRQAHSFSGYYANNEPGATFSIQTSGPNDVIDNYVGNFGSIYNKEIQLVGGAGYQMNNNSAFTQNNDTMLSRHPDLPPYEDWARAANAFGDFDSGLSSAREGPYINKPDEGNFYANSETRNGTAHFERQAYFRESWEDASDWRSGIYMTPNRLIASAVMFGSLPTGVWQTPGGLPSAQDLTGLGGLDYAPWQTLLFRPHSQITGQQPNSHQNHPGAYDPADHYLLDMFFMPVVEPYAISEPLSIAGRVNMNYQMMPFPHIRRATGLHAVMKGEYITAVPANEINRAKGYRPRNGGTAWDDTFWNDNEDSKFWHRPIDVRATLRQFDNRFRHTAGTATNAMGLFRSATQICETHLVPVDVTGSDTADANAQALRKANSQADFDAAMNDFWSHNRVTGDNVRERSYSNIYARLTTRTNTFRVHMRTQTLKKARSTDPATFDAVKDAVISEYRGSALLERYIDPNDGSGGAGDSAVIPDYAGSAGPFAGNLPPLDAFYRFRIIESKRFAP